MVEGGANVPLGEEGNDGAEKEGDRDSRILDSRRREQFIIICFERYFARLTREI